MMMLTAKGHLWPLKRQRASNEGFLLPIALNFFCGRIDIFALHKQRCIFLVYSVQQMIVFRGWLYTAVS